MIKKLLLTSSACIAVTISAYAEWNNTYQYNQGTVTSEAGIVYDKGEMDIQHAFDLTSNTTVNKVDISSNYDGRNVISFDITLNSSITRDYKNGRQNCYLKYKNKGNSNELNINGWNYNWEVLNNSNVKETSTSYYVGDFWNQGVVNTSDEKYIEYSTQISNNAEKILSAIVTTGFPASSISKGENISNVELDDEGFPINNELYYVISSDRRGDYATTIKSITVNPTVTTTYTNCYTNYIVKEISNNQIENTVTSISIPNTVEVISETAFANASGLSTISLASGSANFALDTKSTDGVDSYYLYHKNGENKDKLLTTCNRTAKRLLELPAGCTVATGAVKGSYLTIVSDDASKIAAYDAGYIYQKGIDAQITTQTFKPSTSYNLTDKVVREDITFNLPTNALVFLESANGFKVKGNNVVIGDKNHRNCSNFVITDAVDYNNTIGEFTAENVTYIRTITSDKWHSIVLPFEAPNSGLNVAKFKNIEGTVINFNVNDYSPLSANTPYFVKGNENNVENITASNKYISKSTTNNGEVYIPFDGAFMGTYTFFNNYERGYRYYTYSNSGNFVYVKADNPSKISPFHAAIMFDESNFNLAAPTIRFIDEFTGSIEEFDNSTALDAIENNVINNNVRDITGKTVNNQIRGQLYIQNGKKYIKK